MYWSEKDDAAGWDEMFQLFAEEIARQAASVSAEMNAKCQANFKEAVKRCEKAEDSLAVRKLLSDTLGKSTFELKDDAR